MVLVRGNPHGANGSPPCRIRELSLTVITTAFVAIAYASSLMELQAFARVSAPESRANQDEKSPGEWNVRLRVGARKVGQLAHPRYSFALSVTEQAR